MSVTLVSAHKYFDPVNQLDSYEIITEKKMWIKMMKSSITVSTSALFPSLLWVWLKLGECSNIFPVGYLCCLQQCRQQIKEIFMLSSNVVIFLIFVPVCLYRSIWKQCTLVFHGQWFGYEFLSYKEVKDTSD